MMCIKAEPFISFSMCKDEVVIIMNPGIAEAVMGLCLPVDTDDGGGAGLAVTWS